MTIGSSMSSGYCSLDEDLEDCFFTAKTSFFRSTPNKVPAKVTAEKLVGRAVLGGRWGGGGCRRGEMSVFLHVWLQVLPKLACSWSQGRAAGGEEGSICLLQAPRSCAGGLHCCRFFSATSRPFACRVGPFLGDPRWRSRV